MRLSTARWVMRVLLLLLVLFSACSETSLQEAYGAPISPECWDRVSSIEPAYLSQRELQAACGVDIAIDGCSFENGVYIEEGQGSETLTHELLHVLLGCEVNDSDPSHSRPEWDRL